MLDCSPQIAFPSRSIWNHVIPPRMGFFAWEASWGRVLTLDQLKRRGKALANRCFLCEEKEEDIDHLLLHCKKVKMLWDLLLSIVGGSWVFPRTVIQCSFLGKGLRWVNNAKIFGWLHLYACSGLFGTIGTCWFLKIRLLLTSGQNASS